MLNTLQDPSDKLSFSCLASSENNHRWFRGRNDLILWILTKKAEGIRNFLQVVCGTGFVINGISKAYPEQTLEASEYFKEGLVFARQRVSQ